MWIRARELSALIRNESYNISRLVDPISFVVGDVKQLRKFETIYNANISFLCTDSAVCTKLGAKM